MVEKAGCQEVVITGDELKKPGGGLGRLPIPISTPGFDNAPYTTAGHWITKDPDNGMHNMGNYRGQVKAEDRIGVLLGRLNWGMRYHIDKWREKGASHTPAAIVIGAPPHVTYAAVTRIPNDQCEYDVAGGLIGQPIEAREMRDAGSAGAGRRGDRDRGHRARTDVVEMEGAFGEFPGYMAQRDYSFFMDVTAITMRKKPIYLSILSQMPPSESSKMRNIGRAAAGVRLLRTAGLDNVVQVEYLECAGSNAVAVVKLKKPGPEDGKKALRILAEKFMGKMLVAVDDGHRHQGCREHPLGDRLSRAAVPRCGSCGGAHLPARSGGGAAGPDARPNGRQAAALYRGADRRDHALALSAAIVAEEAVHGSRHRNLARLAVAAART